jgi:type I restriction enzyme R subunit
MLGAYGRAIEKIVIGSGATPENQMMQILSDPVKAKWFSKLIFDMLKLAV